MRHAIPILFQSYFFVALTITSVNLSAFTVIFAGAIVEPALGDVWSILVVWGGLNNAVMKNFFQR
jgi:hypothetical protein